MLTDSWNFCSLSTHEMRWSGSRHGLDRTNFAQHRCPLVRSKHKNSCQSHSRKLYNKLSIVIPFRTCSLYLEKELLCHLEESNARYFLNIHEWSLLTHVNNNILKLILCSSEMQYKKWAEKDFPLIRNSFYFIWFFHPFLSLTHPCLNQFNSVFWFCSI